MIDCDQNCTRDLDGICDPACRERWADLIDAERERAKRVRREHLIRFFSRWRRWTAINSMAQQACGMEGYPT
jgi:hypothetical protein